MFSDSSSGRNCSSHDRTDGNSGGTSYVCSSGTDSSNWDRGRWRRGAGPVTREATFGGARYQLICANGGTDGATGGAAAGGGADGGRGDWGCDAGGCDTTLAEACVNDDESGGEGYSECKSSSSDGMGETGSVADITDFLDCIGDVSETAFRVISSLVTGISHAVQSCLDRIGNEVEI